MNKSFTLIEILVVIVVIGVLSAFILVGMSSITSKANIARGQAFINSLDNSLLLARVSQWKLDESSVPTAYDSWGTNNGTLKEYGYAGVCDATHCPQIKTTGCVSNNCLYFDGINDYVQLGTWDLTGVSRTVSFWFNSVINPSSLSDNRPLSGNYFDVQIAAGNFQVLIWDTAFRTLTYPASNFNANVWYNISITSTTNNLKLYVDGVLRNENSVFTLTSHPHNLNIGASYGGDARYLNCFLDDIRIYNQAIPTSQINQNYFIGANSLLIKGLISNQEYTQRIINLSQKQ